MENNSSVNNATNATAVSNDPNGLLCAYAGLFIMALIPIWIGAKRSLTAVKAPKEGDEKPETLTNKDAAMFPLYASCFLFGLYLIFKMFSKEYINMLLTFYFCGMGSISLGRAIVPYIRKFVPDLFENAIYFVKIDERRLTAAESLKALDSGADVPDSVSPREECTAFNFQKKDLIAFGIGGAIGLYYMLKKHWIANNIFGLSFSINAIELLHLNKVTTGMILLGGLFVYDVFWVFATEVMLVVAKNFEAPIKVIFPRNILVGPLSPKDFSMLGLGDIVIPGIFIALLLRFDNKIRPGSKLYFITGFISYIIGLALTMVVMHIFKHGQPALLYLVPTCVGFPLIVSLIKGDFKSLLEYCDHPEEESSKETSADKPESKKSN